jgi:hypothetical protein
VISRILRVFGGAAIAAAIALAGAPARAQSAADVEAARELFKQGSRAADAGNWQEARDRFERALTLKRSPRLLYALGLAQYHTGQLVEALESLRAFLADPSAATTQGSEDYAKTAKQTIAELEKRVASVTLAITPRGIPGLVVTVDGQKVPEVALDLRRLVNPGKREIVASAPGYREARATVTLAEGEAKAVSLTLEAVPMGSQAAPNPGPAGPAPSSPQPASSPAAPSRAIPIGLMAGGAAVLGVGITVGMIGVGEAKAAPTRDGPEAARARTKMMAGDVVGGVGIAAAGAGAVVLVVQIVSAKQQAPARGSVTPYVTGREIGVLGRF